MLMDQGESGHKYTAGVVAEKLNASKAHVSKVVTRLVELGFVDAVKGRGGGIYLVDSAMEKSVGHLLRILEDHEVVDCAGTGCPMVSGCLLRGKFAQAQEAFFATLDPVKIIDLVPRRKTTLVPLGETKKSD